MLINMMINILGKVDQHCRASRRGSDTFEAIGYDAQAKHGCATAYPLIFQRLTVP